MKIFFSTVESSDLQVVPGERSGIIKVSRDQSLQHMTLHTKASHKSLQYVLRYFSLTSGSELPDQHMSTCCWGQNHLTVFTVEQRERRGWVNQHRLTCCRGRLSADIGKQKNYSFVGYYCIFHNQVNTTATAVCTNEDTLRRWVNFIGKGWWNMQIIILLLSINLVIL